MDIESLVHRHLAVWSDDDARRRRDAFPDLYDADVRLVEPNGEGRGHDAVEGAIAGLQAALPGSVLSVDGPIGHHHDAVNYRWGLGPRDGAPVAGGSDVLLLGGDGRIATLYVFIDAP